jgi:hypothetical protein
VTFTPHMSDVLAAYGLFVQNSLGDADAAEALYKVRSMRGRLGRARSLAQKKPQSLGFF